MYSKCIICDITLEVLEESDSSGDEYMTLATEHSDYGGRTPWDTEKAKSKNLFPEKLRGDEDVELII